MHYVILHATYFCAICCNTLEAKNVAAERKDSEIVAEISEQISDKIAIDPNLVQIQANAGELNRRIKSFIERKRQQVNVINVQEFCCHRLVHYYG